MELGSLIVPVLGDCDDSVARACKGKKKDLKVELQNDEKRGRKFSPFGFDPCLTEQYVTLSIFQNHPSWVASHGSSPGNVFNQDFGLTMEGRCRKTKICRFRGTTFKASSFKIQDVCICTVPSQNAQILKVLEAVP